MRFNQPVLDFGDGETVTLERTGFVDKLIDAQRVTVIDADPLAVTHEIADRDAAEAREVIGVPARNAPRADWAAFLTAHHIDVDDDATRTTLIDLWDHHDCDDHEDTDS